VVFDTLRAGTRTVLLDQAVASSSKNRLLVASEACAKSPTRAPVTATSAFAVAPAARLGRSQDGVHLVRPDTRLGWMTAGR
jgi:hypothetical protein